jgi:hypothetical protein
VVHADRDPERRLVLACATPADHLVDHTSDVRDHLLRTAREVSAVLAPPG